MSEVQICDKIKKYRLKRNYDCRIIVCVNRSIWVLWAEAVGPPRAAGDLERALFLIEHLRDSKKTKLKKCKWFITLAVVSISSLLTLHHLSLIYRTFTITAPPPPANQWQPVPLYERRHYLGDAVWPLKLRNPPEADSLIESGGVEVPWVQGLGSR